MPTIDLRSEIARIRAMEWDKIPAAYERLCSEYACRCAHLETNIVQLHKQIDRLEKLTHE